MQAVCESPGLVRQLLLIVRSSQPWCRQHDASSSSTVSNNAIGNSAVSNNTSGNRAVSKNTGGKYLLVGSP